MKDFRGTTIENDARIVYPVRRGSQMGMVEGIVTGMTATALKVRRVRESSTYADIDNFWTRELLPEYQRTVTVAPSRVTVIPASA